MAMATRITRSNQTTIPKRVREAMRLRQGDFVAWEIGEDTVTVRKQQLVDPVDEWLDSDEIQAAIRETEEDIAAGRVPEPLETGQQVLEYFRKLRERQAKARRAVAGGAG